MVSQPQLKRPEFKDLAGKRRKSRRRAVAGYHWGLPDVGTIQKDGNGYAFVPVEGLPRPGAIMNRILQR